MRTDELDYHLPENRIATHAVEPRDAARLMVIHRDTGRIEHRLVRDLPELGVLKAGDLMAVNHTRVLPAAFEGIREQTGGRVKGLYLKSPDHGHWLVMLESRGKLQPGERLRLDDDAALLLVESVGRGEWKAVYLGEEATESLLGRIGQTPLPPYIKRARRSQDEAEIQPEDLERYNTIYATQTGSVAAPTAGLHFTPALLRQLEAQGVQRTAVTLHVGMGTFAPVRTETLDEHAMHEEWIHVSAQTLDTLKRTRAAGGRILAVGTTTVRALESLPEPIEQVQGDYADHTRLFIQPDAGFSFRFTDMLMTNFHLPRSTLLALVAALPGVGMDRLKQWYQIAIDEGYRFYSYGDAMLLC